MKKKDKEPVDSRYWFKTILYKIPCDILLAFLVLLAEGWFGNRSDLPGHPSGGLALLFLLVAGLVTLGMVIHALRLRKKRKRKEMRKKNDLVFSRADHCDGHCALRVQEKRNG